VRPRFELLDRMLIERMLAEAFELLQSPGVKVETSEARDLLSRAGARIEDDVAHLPENMVRSALVSAPREFFLYDRAGQPVVRYGGDHVHFDPGSSCLNILDAETQQARPARSVDLVRLVQTAEMLPQYAAQSTAMVCNDVPSEVGDLYRLFLVLWYSSKPVVTGAFHAQGLGPMTELMAADSGGAEQLKKKPRAIFDVCPSPPLQWSEFAAQNIVELARAGVPAEIISMPMAGATGPVTLAGSVVQHAAETLAGITIHQLAQPGAPVVWGGAPAMFDMRSGTTPMGAIETAMLDCACAQVGKYFGLPTHTYMVATDAKSVDEQAGMESASSALLGALTGINMISGAGMLDSLACHSIEKLVLDAEAIASAQKLLEGVTPRGKSIALDTFAQTGLRGNFLQLKETRTWFRSEQHFPSSVIERGGVRQDRDIFSRARARVEELVGAYRRPEIPPDVEQRLQLVVERELDKVGVKTLPGVPCLR
jgi:trimethylamine:corrinoid methyltransferase-like protein